jgi:hypothetical protein
MPYVLPVEPNETLLVYCPHCGCENPVGIGHSQGRIELVFESKEQESQHGCWDCRKIFRWRASSAVKKMKA